MAILDIRILGDAILRKNTVPVDHVGPAETELIANMIETMRAANGIGIAAPQVGRSERIAVIEMDGQAIVLVNPVVTQRDGSVASNEGCLSIPDIRGDIKRAKTVKVRYMDERGEDREIEAGDLLGRCLQHEIDHLEGRLFIDHMGEYERGKLLKRWAGVKNLYPGHLRQITKPRQTSAIPL